MFCERGAAADRFRITIDGQHLAVRAIENGPGIPAASEGAVDVMGAIARRDRLQDLLEENRRMIFRRHFVACCWALSIARAAASRSSSTGAKRALSQISNFRPMPI